MILKGNVKVGKTSVAAVKKKLSIGAIVNIIAFGRSKGNGICTLNIRNSHLIVRIIFKWCQSNQFCFLMPTIVGLRKVILLLFAQIHWNNWCQSIMKFQESGSGTSSLPWRIWECTRHECPTQSGLEIPTKVETTLQTERDEEKFHSCCSPLEDNLSDNHNHGWKLCNHIYLHDTEHYKTKCFYDAMTLWPWVSI